MKKTAVAMSMPEGKLPGFYAQVVKALAGSAALFDRSKETLILENASDLNTVSEIMNKYNIEYDTVELYVIPDQAQLRPASDDYIFTGKTGRYYMDTELAFLFQLLPGSADSDPQQALEQMEEHLLAHWVENGQRVYVTQRHLDQLMEKTSSAYGCTIAEVH
ncbi:hypothetical protein [Paenibacillus turpanensis]|uniref:hypothetical protein n=1 Tax=Paenibacillus turpanensis TaxID=2689078 RepID=UPI001407F152|nr:hypothetical protein [Paenibacillus turpanensis]